MSGGRPHSPVATVKLMNPDLFAFDRWHWELRWQVEFPPELPPSPDRPSRPFRSATWNGGWARSQRKAEKAASRAWAKVLKDSSDKPTIRYNL